MYTKICSGLMLLAFSCGAAAQSGHQDRHRSTGQSHDKPHHSHEMHKERHKNNPYQASHPGKTLKVEVMISDINKNTQSMGENGKEGLLFSKVIEIPLKSSRLDSNEQRYDFVVFKEGNDLGVGTYLADNEKGNRVFYAPKPQDQALVFDLSAYKEGKRKPRVEFESKIIVFQGVENIGPHACECEMGLEPHMMHDARGNGYVPLFSERNVDFKINHRKNHYISGDFLIQTRIVK